MKLLHYAALALAVASAAGAQERAVKTTRAPECLAPAAWYTFDAAGPHRAEAETLLRDVAKRQVVLLGEQHDSAEDHAWQLQTLAALHLLRPRLVIGFEAFPRRVQPVLDRWIAGTLTAQQLLQQTEWDKVWRFPPALYLPLFEFARLNRIPMVALNVEHTLNEAVSARGWDAVPDAQKEGVSRPAAPPAAYEDMLYEVYLAHGKSDPAGKSPSRENPPHNSGIREEPPRSGTTHADPPRSGTTHADPPRSGTTHADPPRSGTTHVDPPRSGTTPEDPHGKSTGRNDPAFRRFVESQITWDRAMAEALAARTRAPGGSAPPLVVGIAGSGHLRHQHGVAHQLHDLGVRDVATLLPSEPSEDCSDLKPGLADAVFAVARAPREAAPQPRLGVQLGGKADAVEIVAITPGSLAEQTGLRKGDRMVTLAGVPVKTAARVVAAVRAQPPGTWLPMQVRRGDETLELVIRFPPEK